MKTHSHKQIINLVIIVVPIAVVLSTLFLRPKMEVSSYEECIAKKDSMLMLSYPAKCITKDGKKFTEPKKPTTDSPDRMDMDKDEISRTYEECISQEGSVVMESYPEQCMYLDGEVVTRELSDDEIVMEPSEEYFTCPEKSWVNCMPTIISEEEDTSTMTNNCTPEFEQWAFDNCPGFEGFAY